MRATPRSWTAGVGCLLAASCGGGALPPAGAVFTDGSRLKAIWEPQADACGLSNRSRARRTASPYVGALYRRVGTSCNDVTSDGDWLAMFELGPEIPPDAFVPIATSDHYPAR